MDLNMNITTNEYNEAIQILLATNNDQADFDWSSADAAFWSMLTEFDDAQAVLTYLRESC